MSKARFSTEHEMFARLLCSLCDQSGSVGWYGTEWNLWWTALRLMLNTVLNRLGSVSAQTFKLSTVCVPCTRLTGQGSARLKQTASLRWLAVTEYSRTHGVESELLSGVQMQYRWQMEVWNMDQRWPFLASHIQTVSHWVDVVSSLCLVCYKTLGRLHTYLKILYIG